MRSLLVNSSIFRFIERVVVIVTTLLLTPYLINTLGDSHYGLWILILSVLGWFNVIDLGFPSAVQRYITLALAKKDDQAVNIVFSTSIVLFGVLGVLAGLGILVVVQFPALFSLNEEQGHIFTLALSVLVLKVIFDFLMNAFFGFFSGLLRFDIDANISSLNSILKAILVFILLKDLHIWAAVIATVSTDILTNILKIYYAKQLFKPLRFSWKLVKISEIKSLFSYSKHVIASGIANTLNNRVDPILVTKLFDLPSVTMYSIALRLASHIKGFSMTINGTFAPAFTQMVAKGKAMNRMFDQLAEINFFVSTILFLPLLVLGEMFIVLWVGEKYSESYILVYFIVFSFLCMNISGSVRNVLLAQANHQLLALVSLVGAIFNITLSIIFSNYWGLTGVAMGTALGFFISDVIGHLILLKHYNAFSFYVTLRSFGVSVFLVFLIGMFGHYIVHLYIPNTWLYLISLSLLTFSIALITAWFLILSNEIQTKLLETIATKLKITKK